MRFISGGNAAPLETIRSIAQRSLAVWDEHGKRYRPWAAIEKETGRWVGRIRLNLLAETGPAPTSGRSATSLRARVLRGRGLATEGAREAIRFGWARTTLLPRIISATACPASGLPAGRGEMRPWCSRARSRSGHAPRVGLVRHRPAGHVTDGCHLPTDRAVLDAIPRPSGLSPVQRAVLAIQATYSLTSAARDRTNWRPTFQASCPCAESVQVHRRAGDLVVERARRPELRTCWAVM